MTSSATDPSSLPSWYAFVVLAPCALTPRNAPRRNAPAYGQPGEHHTLTIAPTRLVGTTMNAVRRDTPPIALETAIAKGVFSERVTTGCTSTAATALFDMCLACRTAIGSVPL